MDEAAERRKRLKSIRDAAEATPSSTSGSCHPCAGSTVRVRACICQGGRGPLDGCEAADLEVGTSRGSCCMQRQQLASMEVSSTRWLRRSRAHHSQHPVSRSTGWHNTLTVTCPVELRQSQVTSVSIAALDLGDCLSDSDPLASTAPGRPEGTRVTPPRQRADPPLHPAKPAPPPGAVFYCLM